MVADQLFEREAPEGGHAEYRLSPRGLDLWGVLLAMWQWERDHGTGIDPLAAPSDRPRPALRHTVCGQRCEPVYACDACRQPVTAFDTAIALGATPLHRPALDPATTLPPRKRYRKSSRDDRDSLPALLRTYGDRWNTALVAAALRGARTFSDFERRVAIGPTQLADRLTELQSLGLLRARRYAGSRQEYRLTRTAIAAYPITLELMRWGDRWLWLGRSPLPVAHRPCGHVLGAGWRCGACGGAVDRQTLQFASVPPLHD
jgi:DNA-binding HxlR family transcriptional regulator